MTLITPVGKSNFQWSPRESDVIVKTASTKETAKQSSRDVDKEALYKAAKAVVKAQLALEEEIIESPLDSVDGVVDVVDGVIGDVSDSEEVIEDAEGAPFEGEEGGTGDVQEAVAELVEKANQAEEVAAAVTDALGKVEEAVQEVKDAVGAEIEEEVSEEIGEIEIEIEDDEEPCDEGPCDDEDEDEIVQESGENCEASTKAKAKTAATESDGFVSLAKISPSTRKKVYTYWTKYLKYPADYSKLLVTDYE